MLTSALQAAEPYIPASDSELIEILEPTVIALARTARLNEIHRRPQLLSENDKLQYIRKILDSYNLAVREESSRAYGYTQALLENWPGNLEQPPLLRIIHAALLQRSHDFDEAKAELEIALAIDPDNHQALLMLAQIDLVMGNYAGARRSCQQLIQQPFMVLALNCQAQLDSLSGNAEIALDAVTSALELEALSRPDALELHTTAATIAHRTGLDREAELHYLQALEIAAENTYLLVNYADWLLEHGRPADAANLLSPFTTREERFELKVIYLLALKRAYHDVVSTSLDTLLNDQIKRMQLRQDDSPHKVLARYALDIEGDAVSALEHAARNWEQQKEPGDALLLVRAASQADSTEHLQKIRSWLLDTKLQDVRIGNLIGENNR